MTTQPQYYLMENRYTNFEVVNEYMGKLATDQKKRIVLQGGIIKEYRKERCISKKRIQMFMNLFWKINDKLPLV